MSQLLSTANIGTKRRFGAAFFALVLLATVFSSLFITSSARAADDACAPHDVAAEFMVEGTLLDGDKPVVGAKVVVTGEGVTVCGITDDTGYFLIDAPKAGNYIASIDVTTLPAGTEIAEADNQQPVDLVSTNNAAILFPMGEATSTAPSFFDQLVGYLFQGLNFGLMLAICSLGVSLVFGTTGFSNFAHGETVTIGALLAWFFAVVLQLPILLAGAVTIALVALYGVGQNKLIWRPLRKRRLGLNQTMIVSIGFAMAIRYLLLILFNGDTKDLSANTEQVTLGPIHTTNIALISMVVCVITLSAIAYFLTRTRIGKATRAVSDNAALASATGIDIESIISTVWLIAAGTTAIAGIFFGLQYQANWQTGSNILLLMFAATTLGGLGTAMGTTVGALVIGMVVQVSAIWIPTDLTFATALVILILTLLVRPQGILGKKQRLG